MTEPEIKPLALEVLNIFSGGSTEMASAKPKSEPHVLLQEVAERLKSVLDTVLS